MIYSTLNKPGRSVAHAGEKEKPEYGVKIDERGHKSVYVTGKTNIYDRIQAARPMEIQSILDRALRGDVDAMMVVNQRQGAYADVTEAPKTLAEMQQLIIDAKREFEKLPREIRGKFSNDIDQYIAQYGTMDWATKMGLIKEQAQAGANQQEVQSEQKQQ